MKSQTTYLVMYRIGSDKTWHRTSGYVHTTITAARNQFCIECQRNPANELALFERETRYRMVERCVVRRKLLPKQ